MAATTNEIIQLLDQIIAKYRPGGEFGKAELALLERAKTKAMATSGQAIVSAGLAGTTVGAGAPQRWEEEVGQPERLRLADIASQRLTEAMGAKAGYLERAEAATQQQKQFEAGLLQTAAERYSRTATPGVDVFGKPLSGSLAAAQMAGAGAAVGTHEGATVQSPYGGGGMSPTSAGAQPTKLPTYAEWLAQGNRGSPDTYNAAMMVRSKSLTSLAQQASKWVGQEIPIGPETRTVTGQAQMYPISAYA